MKRPPRKVYCCCKNWCATHSLHFYDLPNQLAWQFTPNYVSWLLKRGAPPRHFTLLLHTNISRYLDYRPTNILGQWGFVPTYFWQIHFSKHESGYAHLISKCSTGPGTWTLPIAWRPIFMLL